MTNEVSISHTLIGLINDHNRFLCVDFEAAHIESVDRKTKKCAWWHDGLIGNYFLNVWAWCCSLCLAMFLVKTMKRVLFAETRNYTSETSRHHYALLAMGALQVPLALYLGIVRWNEKIDRFWEWDIKIVHIKYYTKKSGSRSWRSHVSHRNPCCVQTKCQIGTNQGTLTCLNSSNGLFQYCNSPVLAISNDAGHELCPLKLGALANILLASVPQNVSYRTFLSGQTCLM